MPGTQKRGSVVHSLLCIVCTVKISVDSLYALCLALSCHSNTYLTQWVQTRASKSRLTRNCINQVVIVRHLAQSTHLPECQTPFTGDLSMRSAWLFVFSIPGCDRKKIREANSLNNRPTNFPSFLLWLKSVASLERRALRLMMRHGPGFVPSRSQSLVKTDNRRLPNLTSSLFTLSANPLAFLCK